MAFVSEIGPSAGSQSLSDYHQRLMDSMRRYLGDAPADWFHDAVRLSAPERGPALRAPAYAVALLLQQVEQRLRAILLPADLVGLRHGMTCQQEVDAIGQTYKLSPEDLGRWQHCHLLLERAFSESSPMQEASNLVGEHAALFSSLLDRMTKHFHNVLKKIDLLPMQPEVDTVKALLRVLPESDVVQDHLLKKLPVNGRYLDVLRLTGFFRRPPAPVRDSGGTIRYHPSWPASRYLAQVVKQFPAEVGAILNELPRTDNHQVRGDLAKAACQIPTPMMIAWLHRELPWFLQHEAKDEHLEDELGRVAAELIERGEFDEASSVLRQLLEYPTPPRDEAQEQTRFAGPENRQWYAQGIVREQIPLLIQKQPRHAFDLLCAVLQSIQRWHGSAGFDYLSSHRQQIAPAAQASRGVFRSFEQQLIDLTLQAAESLVTEGQLAYVIDALRERPGFFFRRMTLHMLRCHPEPAMTKVIREELLAEQSFVYDNLDPEYADLLAAHIGSFSAAERGRIWNWLQTGPSEEQRELVRSYFRPDEQSIEVEQFVQRWRYRRMQRLHKNLPATLLPEYEGLERRYAPETKEAPPALLSPQELLALDPATLLARLQEGPTRSAERHGYQPTQADKLREAVAQDPKRFAEQPGMFLKLTAEYQGAFFEGLHNALSKPGQPDDVPWSFDRVLLFAREVVEKASPGDRQPVDLGIARVLNSALVHREKPLISIAEFDTLFSILDGLLRTPKESYEGRTLGRTDYPILLFNTARGLALSTLLAAARWKKRELADYGTTETALNQIWPDFSLLLSALLLDEDPLVHASLGEEFWRLRYLDESWLQANVERIFPTAPDKQILFDAAWSMFVSRSGYLPDENWLALLRPFFHHALRLRAKALKDQPTDAKQANGSTDDRILARTLGTLYLYGLLDLAAGDLLDLYFAHAGDDNARSVVDLLCHNLEREPSRHSDAAQNVEVGSTAQLATWVQRARELWNWRRASILPSIERHSNEAAAFVHLFLLEHFSAAERLDSLEVLLPTAKLTFWESELLTRLAALASDYPARCLQLARVFLQRGGYPDPDSTRALLTATLHCGDPGVESDTRELINQLSAGGYSKMDDLLMEAPAPAASAVSG